MSKARCEHYQKKKCLRTDGCSEIEGVFDLCCKHCKLKKDCKCACPTFRRVYR
jgi:hypothetical protein